MNTRKYWVDMITRMARPVLTNYSKGQLSRTIQIETCGANREQYMCLEILGRTLAGIAPWLECKLPAGEEETLRQEYATLARLSLEQATDPQSPDYCFAGHTEKEWAVQWLVDAAFLSLALVRAPGELVHKLPAETRQKLADCLRKTRNYRPAFSNWLLFSGMVEAGLYILGEDYDIVRIDYCLRQTEQWYKGDGLYSDGPGFKMDYYNSYVIHPLYVTLVELFHEKYKEGDLGQRLRRVASERLSRYAKIQEESVAPDGSYPPFGRSIVYRCGAFHALAQAAYMGILPGDVTPAMARGALTRVIQKTLDAPGTFSENGWLTVGLCGHQHKLGVGYITTASLYLATCAFLPLGLSPDDKFWKMPDEMGTWEKIFTGVDMSEDHALINDEKIL